MPFIVEILKSTPPWVFVLFAFIVWQGLLALRVRTASIWRLLILPAIFVVTGVARILVNRNDGPWPPLAWLAAACLLAVLGLATGPKLLSVDRARKLVTRPGSALPLLRNVIVFTLQYGVAVETALHPTGHLGAAIAGRAISGATAGYFIGWAWTLRKRYLAAPATQ